MSVGISLFPQDAEDGGGLQRNAEAAMYECKKAGPAGYVISSRGAFDSGAKLQFVTRLRKAVESAAVDPALPAGGRARDRARCAASRR